MKLSFCLLFSLLIVTSVLSQPNTVALKDASGTLISTHATIVEAYNAIPTPMSQAYLIELLAGYNASSETFPITLGVKSGASDSNRITIRPAAGNTGVIISSNPNTAVVLLDDADYITFDGRPGGIGNQVDMKIQNLNSGGSSAHTIRLINGATYNIFQYLHLYGASMNTAGPRNFDFTTSASNPTGNSYNLIRYCKIEGSRSGLGFAGTSANPNTDNKIHNCEIYNWGYAGVWLSSNVRNFTMEDCLIYHTTGYNSTAVSGIISSTSPLGELNLRRNKFYDLQSSATSSTTIRAIYVSTGTGSTLNIENNFISMTKDNNNVSAYYGIHLLGTTPYTANVYYNTVRIGGTHISGGTSGSVVSCGILKAASNSATIFNIKNNICVNTRTGGSGVLHLGSQILNTEGVLDINYNCYYASGGANSYTAGWGSSYFNNLNDYQTAAAPQEANTKFKNVEFVSNTDLHLTGNSIGDADLFGVPIPGILTDIDGDLRNPVSPYKGADEAQSSGVTNVTFTTDSLWNIVSVPGTTSTTNKDSLFKGNVSNAYWFDGSAYTVVTELTKGKGYWLKFNEQKSHTIGVMASNTMDINVINGWNMIGAMHVNIPIANITSNPPGIIASQFYGFSNGYIPVTTLEKGKGYWVKTNSAGVLTLSPTLSKNYSENISKTLETDLPTIIITDAVGRTQRLYLSNDNDLGKYELPPLPPSNAFDVRFTTDRFIEDLSGEKEIRLQGAVYPIKFEVRNSECKIKDKVSGKFVDKVLKEGEQLVVSYEQLTLFSISVASTPTRFELMQNYPNPFNPTTKIRFSISDFGFVSLKVFDILGREVVTLINEQMQAGQHTVEWNASNFPSGVYIYRLTAGSYSDMKKMILMK